MPTPTRPYRKEEGKEKLEKKSKKFSQPLERG
jgi:hypothetical protein